MKNRRVFLKEFAIVSLILFSLYGCVGRFTEGFRVAMGTSLKALEETKTHKTSETFKYDYKTCYEKMFSLLKGMKAYIYLHSFKKQRIVAMNFKGPHDTTEVGIFFSELTPNSTKVEIRCLSKSVLENISEKIFSALKDKTL